VTSSAPLRKRIVVHGGFLLGKGKAWSGKRAEGTKDIAWFPSDTALVVDVIMSWGPIIGQLRELESSAKDRPQNRRHRNLKRKDPIGSRDKAGFG